MKTKKRGKKIKFSEILNSKPVIGALIFIMLSLATVLAGNVIVKEGDSYFDGNVGIGTTSPASKLHVLGSLASEADYDSLDDGLVLDIPFSEGTGTTVTDKSKYGNNGAWNGDPAWETGKLGYGLYFDGDGDYLNAGNAASLDVDTFTASSWIKTTGTGYKMWMARGSGQYWLAHHTSRLDFVLTTTTGRTDLFATVNYYDNNWHHVVNTYDGAYMRMYMDGKEINSVAKTGTISGLGPLLIGRYSGTYQYTGSIDEVRLYNRALTADEIRELYERGLGTQAPYVDIVTGNVGINTTTPQNTLNVIGDINFTGLIYGNGSQLTFDKMVLLPGSNTAPSYTFWGDPNTGMYRGSADNLMFATGGVNRLTINVGGLEVVTDSLGPGTDKVVNVVYGTGSPPTASTTTIGTIWVKYAA